MPPRVNKKLLLIIVGVLVVLAVVATFWVTRGASSTARRVQVLEDAQTYQQAGEKQKEQFVYESWIARNPKDTEIRMRLARLMDKEGRASEAYNEYRNVVRYDPLNLEALKRIAYYEGEFHRWGEMRRVAKTVVDLVPQDGEARLYMAKACLGLGADSLPEALENARLAVAGAPNNIDAYLTLARIHQERKSVDEARKVLEDALKIDPKSQDLYSFLGGFHMRLGEREEAEAALKAALANATNVCRGYVELAAFYAVTEDWEKAEANYLAGCDNATQPSDKLSTQVLTGDFYVRWNKLDKALEHYDEALVTAPQAAEVVLKKAHVYLQLNKLDEVHRAAEDVKARGRRDRFHVQALFVNGLAYLQESRIDEAVQELERALSVQQVADLQMNTADIHLALAQAFLRRGQADNARESLLRAYAEAPNSQRIMMALARLLYARREYDQVVNILNTARKPHEGQVLLAQAWVARGNPADFESARKVLEAERKREPDDPAVHAGFGQLCIAERKYDEAVTHFDQVVKLTPGREFGYLAKAGVYELAGKPREAERAFRTAVEKLPSNLRVRYEFARFLNRINRFADGEKLLLDEINRLPDDSPLRSQYEDRLPRYYMDAGQVDKALEWYRKKAEQDPKNVPVRQMIVMTEMLRDPDEAAKYIAELKGILKEDHPLVQRLEGQLLVVQRQYEPALRKLEAAAKADPNDSESRYYMGLCYLRTGRAQQAYPFIQDVHTRFPTNQRVQRALAEVYYTLGNFEEAKKLVEQLRAAGQGGPAIDIMEADVFTKTGEEEQGEAAWRTFTRRNPDRSEGWIGLADALWRQGQQVEAIAAMQKGYELDEKSFRTTWTLTNMYSLRKEFDKAIAVAEDSLQKNKDNLALLGLLARLYEMAEKPDEAQKTYERIGKLDPTNPLPAVARGDRALAQEDLPRAEAAYREALRLRGENRIVRTRLIDVLMKQNKPTEALAVVDEALRADPNDIGVTMLKGRVLLIQDKPDDAIREFKRAVKISRDAGLERRNYMIHQELGQTYLRLGRLGEARESFQATRDLRPDLVEPRLSLVDIALRQGHTVEARAECLGIIESGPDLRALLILGDIARRDKNPDLAEKYYRRAIEAFPKESLPVGRLGEVLLEQKKTDEGIAAFKKVVELDGYHAASVAVLADVLVSQKRYDEAIAACTESLKKAVEPSAIYLTMGNVETVRERYAKAREYYDESLRLRPGMAAVYLARAATYVAEKNNAKAVEEARAGLKADPKHEASYQFLERLYHAEARQSELDALYLEWIRNMPDSVIAANNQAWYLTETKKDPDAALRVIDTFRRTMTAARKPFRFTAELYDTEGRAWFAKGDYKQAVDLFGRSLEVRRNSAATWEHLRLAYVKLYDAARAAGDELAARRYEIEATNAFTKVRELSPESFDMQAQLGDMRLGEGKIQEAIDAYQKALEIKKDPVVQRKLAEILIRDGRTEDASRHVTELVESNPNEPLNLVLEGMLLSRLGKSDEAIDLLEKVVEKAPKLHTAAYVLAGEYISRGMMEKGRAALDKTIEMAPDFSGARLLKAKLLAADGKFDEAVTQCKTVIDAEPMNFEANYNMGNFQLAQAKIPDAEKTFKAMIRQWPDSVLARERLAETYRRSNRLGEALLEFQDARRRNPRSLMILRGMSIVLIGQGKADRAIREYGTYLEDNPQATDAWLDLARLHVQTEGWAEAERALKNAVKTARTSPEVHRAMVDFYSQRKMFKEAREAALRMMEDIPTKRGASMGRTLVARAWELEGSLDDAIREYRLAVDVDPTYPVPANNLAWILATKKNQPAEAIKIAEPHLEKNQVFAELYDTVGWAYRLADQPKKAEPLLAHSIQVQVLRKQVLPTILYHYGEVLFLNGKTAEAKKFLDMALKVRFPEYDRAKEIRDKIK